MVTQKFFSFAKFSIASGLLISLSGCPFLCKNEGPGTIHIISETARGFVPYPGNENLRFRHNSGLITTFTGTTDIELRDASSCFEGCCPDDKAQVQNYYFKGDDPPMNFQISLMAGNPEDPFEIPEEFYLSFSNASYHIVDPSANFCEGRNPCINSLTVNGSTYINVIRMKMTSFASNGEIVPDSAWYTPINGLIKFKMTDGQYWELQP